MTETGWRRLLARSSDAVGWRAPPLKVVSELERLTHVPDVRKLPPAFPGLTAELVEPVTIEEPELQARLEGRTGGTGMPAWHDGTDGALMFGVQVSRVPDAAYAPEFGAVILRDGSVMRSTVAEALYYTPTLAALPFVTAGPDGPVIRPPVGTPTANRLAVFVAWGGRFNYGHFLLDCLASLVALESAGLLERHRPVAPPLTGWQLELLELLGFRGRVRQTERPLLLAREIVFATPMDHFLHAPNAPLDQVRARILAALDRSDAGPRRLYLSRRDDVKRRLVNESELEAALEARGFTVVSTGGMSITQQAALFRDAEVVVAPTGAALANCLFCRPGTKVFEIQPENFTGIWARAVSHFVGADWHGWFAPSPIEESDFVVEGVSRPGTLFAWRLPLPEFLAFLDERL